MRRNFYEAFTLVEMLIVMGILIILMAIGITAGRFAINRANDVAHQNAVDQIYQGVQAYYTDNRAFPEQTDPETLLTTELVDYLDEGAFKGGTEASYFYIVDDLEQAVLVCVSLRGTFTDNNGRNDGGYYCNGNGFGSADLPVTITEKTFKNGDPDFTTFIALTPIDTYSSDWDGSAWQ